MLLYLSGTTLYLIWPARRRARVLTHSLNADGGMWSSRWCPCAEGCRCCGSTCAAMAQGGDGDYTWTAGRR